MSGDASHVPIQQLPETERTREIQDAFVKEYKKKPDFFVRVPGRVNLIGEHVDYCGYSVCPMALEQDILLAISIENDSKLNLHNLDKHFEDYQCDLHSLEISIGDGAPKWYQYFLCGVKGVIDVLPKGNKLKGMNIFAKGSIPQSAGLSSSSALVSAAALATAYANKFEMSKNKLASLSAECERYIGTEGGGMDQAIAFLATEGCAKLIEFSPLRSKDVKLPEGAVFVIAHSLTNLNKAATADFNCRVIECRLAAQIIAKKRNLEWTAIKRLGDLQKSLDVNLPEMIRIVEETLHDEPYTKDEILKELDTTTEKLNETSLTPNTQQIRSFKLKQRALHVFKEALRVEKFHDACAQSGGEETLKVIGKLMSESHSSLRDLYECSHSQLDRLVELSRDLTLGSRLTGAGWGGCAVSLLLSTNVDKYLDFLKKNFYAELGVKEDLEKVLFATSPKSGACIYIAK